MSRLPRISVFVIPFLLLPFSEYNGHPFPPLLRGKLSYSMVLFLAGLQDIPTELYEAARIDGAGSRQLFTQITLPLLAPTIFLVTLLSIINSFQVFDQAYVMTSGGPGTSTLTLVQYIYTTAFQFSKMGYGAAIAAVLFATPIIAALIQARSYRRGLTGVS